MLSRMVSLGTFQNGTFPKCPEGNYSRLDRLVVLPFQAGAQAIRHCGDFRGRMLKLVNMGSFGKSPKITILD